MSEKNSSCGSGKSWVKAPRVKKGGYCRGLPKGSGSGLSTPSTSGNAFLKGAAILLSGAVVGGAIGAFASNWASNAGVEKQVKDAIAKADGKTEEEVAKVRQELQGEMAERLNQVKSESEAAVGRKVDATKNEAAKEIERAIAKTRAEMQAEMDAKLATAGEETRSQVQAEYTAKTEKAVESARSEATQSAVRAVEKHKREADMDLAVRRKALETDMEARLKQREAEVTEQVHGAAIQRIASDRANALEEAQAEIRKITDPKARRKGDLVDDDNTGIALSASVRQGMDLNVIPPERMQARVSDAVKRMTARRLEQGLESLNTGFKAKVKEAVSDPKTNATKGWGKIKNILAAQSTREAAFEVGLDDIRKDITTKYKSALSDLHSNASDRGIYDDELLGSFDKKSKKLNDDMQRQVSGLLDEVGNLKTRWDSAYKRSLKSHLSVAKKYPRSRS